MSAAALAAGLAAATAAALVVPTGSSVPAGRRSARRSAWPVLALATVALWWASPTLVAPGLILAVAAAVSWRGWQRRQAQRAAIARAARVVEACAQLASELASGQPPGSALRRAADDWSVLAPVAEAFRVGSDVPAALRGVSALPGAADLRLLAAAWQVAHRTGQGLADAVDRVAQDLLETRATRRLVAGELSSARATARLVALLPVAALAMGSGVGGDPVGFLLRSPPGWACLALGLGFGLAGMWWIESLARGVEAGS